MITFRDDYGTLLKNNVMLEPIDLFDGELKNLISGYLGLNDDKDDCPCGCKELLDKIDPNREYYKIIYAYLNGEQINADSIKYLMQICFNPCKELYYTIPILIYILQKTSSNLSLQNVQ